MKNLRECYEKNDNFRKERKGIKRQKEIKRDQNEMALEIIQLKKEL